MKIYAVIGNGIKVTKEQYDKIMDNQYNGITITQSLIMMGLTTLESAIEDLEKSRCYAQYDVDKKIAELREFAKTLDNKEVVEEVKEELVNLGVKHRTGRSVRTEVVNSSSRKKYNEKYEYGVVTESGKMTQEEWIRAIEKRIVDLKEEHIVEGLINYALEECAWINDLDKAKEYAYDLYARRMWENNEWVGCKEFRKKIGLDAKEEVEEMKYVNIESVEVKGKTINVGARCTIKNDKDVFVTAVVEELRKYDDKVVALTWDGELDVKGLFKIDEDIAKPVEPKKEIATEVKTEEPKEEKVTKTEDAVEIVSLNELVKKDLIKVSNAIYNTRYVAKEKLVMSIKNNVATVVDDTNGTEIVTFEVSKKKKYSVVGDITTLYTENQDKYIKRVATEIIECALNYGTIKKIHIQNNELAFIVDGHNEDKYLELGELMHLTSNSKVNKASLLKELIKNHLTKVVKDKDKDLEVGDAIYYKVDGINESGTIGKINVLARTVEVHIRKKDGTLFHRIVSFDRIIRTIALIYKTDKIEKNKTNDSIEKESKEVTVTNQFESPKDNTLDKKEVTRVVKAVMELSKDVSTVKDNLSVVDSLIEGAQLHTYGKVATIGTTLKNEKYIGKITKKDIDDDDIKSIGDCSEVYIEVVRDEKNKTLTVGAYVEVEYIYTDGTKGKTGITIKEITEKIPKKANNFYENMIQLK